MLKINSLPNYTIILSEKSDGDFRLQRKKAIQFLQKHGVIRDICHLELEGGTKRIIRPNKKQSNSLAENINTTCHINSDLLADAVITKQKNVCLSMVVADCFPIVLVDPKKQVFALIHAGWKGLIQNIVELTILDMQLQFKVNPKNLIAWIGPGIRECCYHCADKPPIQNELPAWKGCIKKINIKSKQKIDTSHADKIKAIQQNNKNLPNRTHWSIDLAAFIKKELTRLGIEKNKIIDFQQCTHCQENFFSHQRATSTDELDGRFVVAVF